MIWLRLHISLDLWHSNLYFCNMFSYTQSYVIKLITKSFRNIFLNNTSRWKWGAFIWFFLRNFFSRLGNINFKLFSYEVSSKLLKYIIKKYNRSFMQYFYMFFKVICINVPHHWRSLINLFEHFESFGKSGGKELVHPTLYKK